MSHFLYTRPLGTWNTLPIAFSELADFDAKTFKAINGDDGGTWAPASQILIGGAGLQTAGPFIADGTFLVTSGGRIENGLQVTGLTDLQDDAQVGGQLEVTGAVICNSTLNVTSTSTFSDQVTVNAGIGISGIYQGSGLSISGAAEVGSFTVGVDGAAKFYGPTTFLSYAIVCNAGASVGNGALAFGVAGWLSEKFTDGANANMALDPADFTAVYWANTTLSGSVKQCTLSSAARSGATVWLRNDSTTVYIEVIDGTSLVLLNRLNSSSGHSLWAVYKKFGTVWREMAYGPIVP
jgi:hypothetical protein